MTYRFNTSRLTFYGEVDFPARNPEIVEDAWKMRHPGNVWTATCMADRVAVV